LRKYAASQQPQYPESLTITADFLTKPGKRYWEAVERLGYKTNIVAKSLRTKKTKSIGIVVPDITNEFFAKIILTIQDFSLPKDIQCWSVIQTKIRERKNCT